MQGGQAPVNGMGRIRGGTGQLRGTRGLFDWILTEYSTVIIPQQCRLDM